MSIVPVEQIMHQPPARVDLEGTQELRTLSWTLRGLRACRYADGTCAGARRSDRHKKNRRDPRSRRQASQRARFGGSIARWVRRLGCSVRDDKQNNSLRDVAAGGLRWMGSDSGYCTGATLQPLLRCDAPASTALSQGGVLASRRRSSPPKRDDGRLLSWLQILPRGVEE